MISYETLRKFSGQLRGCAELLVCDEGHRRDGLALRGVFTLEPSPIQYRWPWAVSRTLCCLAGDHGGCCCCILSVA